MNRRIFVNQALSTLGIAYLTPSLSFGESGSKDYTVKDIIDRILLEIPGAPFVRTVDHLRSGTFDQQVTGVVTTMFPHLGVIEKAHKMGANLIIAHETPFYNNDDQTDWLQEDEAYLYKIKLLEKYGIALWRFHDYWHRHTPDGIIMGNLIKLGWDNYYNAENQRMLKLPEPWTIAKVCDHIKERLGISSVRLVGNPEETVQTFYLAFGYHDSRVQIENIRKYNPDMILSGETREWETVERIRDGLIMGKKTSLVVLSHSASEEAGMEYAAEWLRQLFPTLSVSHIPSGNPFTFR
jgi:putative NIF3 family GTP cyclohydrolase 1 type 2